MENVSSSLENLPKHSDQNFSVSDYGYIVITALLTPSVLSFSTLVIGVIRKFKRLQTPTNFFIASLASADILVALMIPIFTTSLLLPANLYHELVCSIPNRLLILSCGASILSLAAVAFDRYIALTNSLEYVQIMTKRKTYSLIVSAWIYSALIVSIPMSFTKDHSVGNPRKNCGFGHIHPRGHLLFASMLFFPACVLIFFCYYKIFTIAKHQSRAIYDQEQSIANAIHMRYVNRDCKYAKTLAVLILVFIVFWFPFQFTLLLIALTDIQVCDEVLNYLLYLAAFNSVMNPWLYAYKNTHIRSAFRKISSTVTSAFKQTTRHLSTTTPNEPSLSSDYKLNQTDSRMEQVDIMQQLELNSDMFADDCWAYEPKKMSVHSVGSTITHNGRKIVVPSLVIEDMEGSSDLNLPKIESASSMQDQPTDLMIHM
ncbi:alpha-2A adrenergic receptor-like [Saccostrea echinata]|uniref:alpha-2A adrenergic receptor-like n=1 Tax=Saccostrea echinata TaxID=191078 RepID=UPI002A81D387|nr:alpha-2A adrenergic receptor-like [Saccostrea echinata]